MSEGAIRCRQTQELGNQPNDAQHIAIGNRVVVHRGESLDCTGEGIHPAAVVTPRGIPAMSVGLSMTTENLRYQSLTCISRAHDW